MLFRSQGEELDSLRMENSLLKNQLEEKDKRISSMYEEMSSKDKDLENLFNRIDSALER